MTTNLSFIFFFIFMITGLSNSEAQVITGAAQLDKYLPLLKGKRVGMMANHTSMIGSSHLADVLLGQKVSLQFVFAPEHGFRGTIERGEKVSNDFDVKTGLPIYTLYGSNDKADSIVNTIDIMIFDLQDVGARFYTYITSLDHIMELCAKADKALIILDRPNPCGDQVDGPVRKEDKYKSDVSYHKIAMVHGLTIGELAQMINGEQWLEKGKKVKLHIVKCLNYDHSTIYHLPVAPSPSLTNYLAVRLYASLCLFEATPISVGRGTDYPFQMVGFPNPAFGEFTFTPGTRMGMTTHVENKGERCYGLDLRHLNPDSITFTLQYLIDFYHQSEEIKDFVFFTRPDFFNKLAGNRELIQQIKAGLTVEQIKATWQPELSQYKTMRKKYLLYRDFE